MTKITIAAPVRMLLTLPPDPLHRRPLEIHLELEYDFVERATPYHVRFLVGWPLQRLIDWAAVKGGVLTPEG